MVIVYTIVVVMFIYMLNFEQSKVMLCLRKVNKINTAWKPKKEKKNDNPLTNMNTMNLLLGYRVKVLEYDLEKTASLSKLYIIRPFIIFLVSI